ncbi:uncharacterized protein LOC113360521 [Papaver somniferum]|uniref:uncharacterized protein LOC113360521 n=1 Tax=Papaver somniferum TaxID=3469 RepID=UPI000E6FD3B2|nr:uncharacterized protein LOC113360521 [Papaver somniferum]
MLDAISSAEEIKQTLFDMDPDSSPGPDGFTGSFYKSCWQIIQDDVVNAVQFCWRRRFIPKGLNSNFLVLLPKIEGARSPNQFRPIGLSNVSFKIFIKIINSRMSTLMHKLISPQQAAYIKGRSIQDQIALASEMVNEMKKKIRGGNIGLKLDISQAYDSVSWNFLFQVLKRYGFSETWCKWLCTLFESAKISIMISGGPNGFFTVRRGLRQGDSLSPTLFVLMEDVLSRNISKMEVEESGNFHSMVNGRVTAKEDGCLERNFLWSGDGETRKYTILSWKKVCSRYNEGVLGIQRLEVLNRALLMKILWRIINSGEEWALFLKAKFQDKHGQWKNNCDSPLIEDIGYTDYVKAHINMNIGDIILNGEWSIPDEIKQMLSSYTLPEQGVGQLSPWNFSIPSATAITPVAESPISLHINIYFHLSSTTPTKYLSQSCPPQSMAATATSLTVHLHSSQAISPPANASATTPCDLCP